jgi:putative transcriptional regulator
MMDAQTTLVGKLLVAMPGMGDPRFEHSVVYISAHSEDGAMGLIVNKANAALDLKALLGHLDIPIGAFTPKVAVHFGGPVEPSRGFLLHTADYVGDPDTLRIDERFAVTATVDVIKDLSRGLGPKTSLLALGYAGWAAGQLEAEIRANGWLICDAEFDLVFGLNNEAKWAAALASIGVDPTLLSGQAGRA